MLQNSENAISNSFLDVFNCIDPCLLREKRIFLAAVARDGLILQKAGPELRQDADVVLFVERFDIESYPDFSVK